MVGLVSLACVPHGLTAERHWRREHGRRGLRGRLLCPTRTHRRKALETAVNGDAFLVHGFVPHGLTAERHWRRCLYPSTIDQTLLVPHGLAAERHWRHTDVSLSPVLRASWSHTDSPPKGTGDMKGEMAVSGGTVVPHGLTAERHWRLLPVSHGFQWSRFVPHGLTAERHWRRNHAWIGPAGHPQRPTRTRRRKALETAGRNGGGGIGVAVPHGLTAERHWRPRIQVMLGYSRKWSHTDSPPKGTGDMVVASGER